MARKIKNVHAKIAAAAEIMTDNMAKANGNEMKKHFLFPALFLLAALMAGGLIWYFRSFPSPPQKAADRFLSALSEGRDCIEWLTPDLSKHSAFCVRCPPSCWPPGAAGAGPAV